MNHKSHIVKPANIIAYFDFDGTLTKCDTLLPFIIHTVSIKKLLLKLPVILWIVCRYLLKIINNEEAKILFLTSTIKNMPRDYLEQKAQEFALNKLDKYLKPQIYEKLQHHIKENHTIAIVSANLAVYLKYWAKKHNVNYVIGTNIQFINNIATGGLDGHNCYGMEKVIRIKEFLKTQNLHFTDSYAYGNSRGDFEMLDFAHHSYFIYKNTSHPWNQYKAKK